MREPWLQGTVVGLALSEEWGRSVASQTVVKAGATSLPIAPAGRSGREPTGDYAALIDDGAPWNTVALAQLSRIRRTRPEMPMLLFLPMQAEAMAFVPSLRPLENIRVCVQDPGPLGLKQLGTDINWLLRAVPLARVRSIIAGRLERQSHLVLPLVHSVLKALSVGEIPSVRYAARNLGCCTRTLERLLERAELPRPKELVDWVVMIYIAFIADSCDRSPAAVASALGISPRRLYRTRSRLLATVAPRPMRRGDPWGQRLVGAFEERCRATQALRSAESAQLAVMEA